MSEYVHSPTLEDLDGFHPHDSSPEDRDRVHYPPHPDSKLAPQEHSLWERIAKRNPAYVRVEFIAVDPPEGLYESRNWSGGVLPIRPQIYDPTGTRAFGKRDPFDRVVGSWIVPNPHPQKTSGGEFKDGDYEVYTWVGLDGWENPASLKVGVVSGLQVVNGEIKKRYNYAAILFRGLKPDTFKVVKFDGFIVEPGDLITGYVCGKLGTGMGKAWIINQGRNEWTSGQIKAATGVILEGKSAEWITAGQGPLEPAAHPFPNYGATVFFEGYAGQQSGKTKGIERSLLSDAIDLASIAERGHNILIHTCLSPPNN